MNSLICIQLQSISTDDKHFASYHIRDEMSRKAVALEETPVKGSSDNKTQMN